MRGLQLALGLMFVLLLSGDLLAVDTLRVNLQQASLRARSDAPIPVMVTLNWSGLVVAEGRLEFTFRQGRDVVGHAVMLDIAVANGDQRFRYFLPAIAATFDGEVEVDLEFVTKKERIALGPQTLFVAKQNQRSAVIAVCDARGTANPMLGRIVNTLRWETLWPDGEKRPVQTSLAQLLPDEMPAQALAYCAFDVVVLGDGALKVLRERNREALATWVAGGGSLLVLADADEADGWLHELTGGKREARSRYRYGAGHVVVVRGPAETEWEYATDSWNRLMAHLWKVSDLARPSRPMEDHENVHQSQMRRQGQMRPATALPGEIIQMLMPTEVRLIPVGVLGAVLGLFVLAIGPLDYFGLGWIKRRHWTWVTFPVVTVGFTVATVMLANHYLGRRDYRRALVVVDVTPTGKVLREFRFELLFPANNRETVVDVADAFWRPVATRASRQYYGDNVELAAVLNVAGQVPAKYRARQSLRQWQPQLNRRFAFTASEPVPALDWSGRQAAVPGFDLNWVQRLTTTRGWLEAPGWQAGLSDVPVSDGRAPVKTLVMRRNDDIVVYRRIE